jgi:hypothetical protein
VSTIHQITIHQRLHGYLINWKTGPGWATDRSEIAKLRQDGMRVLKVQLQDSGPIPIDQAKEWRDAGMKVWGMVGHVNDWEDDPEGLAAWLKAERNRLSLTGMDYNFEDEVNGFDARSEGKWSVRFCTKARFLMPTLPMHLDSYWGPMGDKINLGAYKAIGCRFSVQTFNGPPATNVWDDPPTNIVRKGAGAQPVIGKSIIKPLLQTAPRDDGTLPNYNVAIADWKASGCKGGGLYPIESYPDFDKLRVLIREMIAQGVAY